MILPIIGGTINRMQVTYDQAKNERNITDRQLPFGLASRFDFETAKLWQDTRREYPEDRWVAIGYLDNRLHVLMFSPTQREIRIISFRKANPREGKYHGFALTSD